MTEEKFKTRVIFRKWYSDYAKYEDVFAILLDDPQLGSDNYTCYEHIGGHGTGNMSVMLSKSHDAKPDEYAPLLKELERIDYDVVIETHDPLLEEMMSNYDSIRKVWIVWVNKRKWIVANNGNDKWYVDNGTERYPEKQQTYTTRENVTNFIANLLGVTKEL